MLPIIAAAATPLIQSLMSSGLDILASAVANKGKEYVEEKLGVTLEPVISPEKAMELKELEFRHEELLQQMALEGRKLDLEELKAGLADLSDSRGMQKAALAQDDLFSKRFIYWFAMAWCGFAAVYIMAITLMTIPKDSVRFADTILGFLLGTVVSQIIAFFFGSSLRSSNKDRVIEALSRGGK